jgi:hypothetical protein
MLQKKRQTSPRALLVEGCVHLAAPAESEHRGNHWPDVNAKSAPTSPLT